ncbi:MAG: zinc ribbon domain-containing protein [Nitrospirae bacterium]|nr:zinc ribbon domain-containing protein [Nitrospirota bacterium]
MPIYEYICNDCGEEFERLVFGGTVVICMKCASGNIKKKMSAFGMSGVEKPFAGSKDGCGTCSKGSCSSCH